MIYKDTTYKDFGFIKRLSPNEWCTVPNGIIFKIKTPEEATAVIRELIRAQKKEIFTKVWLSKDSVLLGVKLYAY